VQPAPTWLPNSQTAVPPVINWTLQVIHDGHQIDSFDGASTVGQARTDRYQPEGCKLPPQARQVHASQAQP